MLWPFNHFRKPPAALRGTIEAIYGMIVAQAREPLFYRELGVADTVNGRFDLLLMHLWLVLQRLRPAGETAAATPDPLSQGLIDRFCSDMDHNLRELGTSDLKVPKKMQEFGRAFFGRAAAYDRAVAEGPEPLARALDKNVYNGSDLVQARRLASYVAEAMAVLAALDETTLANGSWRFPPPVATET